MGFENDQFDFLTSDPGVSALIVDRLYPVFEPVDSGYPSIAYQFIGGSSGILAHDGATNIRNDRVQYTITAESYSAAKSVSAAVRAALRGYRGIMGGSFVYFCDVTADIDGYDSINNLKTIRIDAIFQYS